MVQLILMVGLTEQSDFAMFVFWKAKKYGVGYLKKDWEFSRYCFKHKLPLSEIISCSYIKTVKAMSDIMQGGT